MHVQYIFILVLHRYSMTISTFERWQCLIYNLIDVINEEVTIILNRNYSQAMFWSRFTLNKKTAQSQNIWKPNNKVFGIKKTK